MDGWILSVLLMFISYENGFNENENENENENDDYYHYD